MLRFSTAKICCRLGMLRLQENCEKRRHLLPKLATFVGFRRDSDTQFVSRETCGMTGETGAPIPISHLYPLPKTIPILPHVSASARPPVVCTPFWRSSIPGSTLSPAHRDCVCAALRCAGVGRCRLAPVPPVLVPEPAPGGRLSDLCGADSGGTGTTSEGISPSLPWGACGACHLPLTSSGSKG